MIAGLAGERGAGPGTRSRPFGSNDLDLPGGQAPRTIAGPPDPRPLLLTATVRAGSENAGSPRPRASSRPAQAPLPALATFELATFELVAYRRQLENAIAFFDAQHPVSPVRDDLQARLDAVLAERDDRARIARA